MVGAARFGDLYCRDEVLDSERRRVLERSWALVATAAELEGAGRYVTAMIGGAPVVIVSDTAGALRGFHNLCRHRGLTLLEGSGQLGRHITCPYHQWSFALDGRLVVVPEAGSQFHGIDLSSLPLRPIEVVEWRGLVFANPSPRTVPFDAAMNGLEHHLGGFRPESLVEVAKVSYEAACNWKLLIENHVDIYHLRYLHSDSLGAYDHRAFEWESRGDNWWSLEPLKDPTCAPSGLANLEERYRSGIGAHLIFPNLMIVTTGAYVATYDSRPISADRSLVTLRVRAEVGTDAAPLVESIRSFMAEDVAVCERLQRAVTSPVFELGPLAAGHEEPVRRFHASLRRMLEAPVSP